MSSIAFDNVASGHEDTGGTTTLTIPIICTGSNITVCAYFGSTKASNSNDVTATFDGNAMTKLPGQLINGNVDCTAVFVYYIGTGSGTSKNVVFTSATGPDRMMGGVISLTGTNSTQNGASGNSNGTTIGTGSNVSETLTTTVNTSWIFGGWYTANSLANLNAVASGTTVTKFSFDSVSRGNYGGYATTTTAGSNTIGWTTGTTGDKWLMSAVEIIPHDIIHGVNVSDTTLVTDSVSIQKLDVVKISDTTVVTDSVNIETSFNPTTDFVTQLTTSNYKWMTSTLLAAQQNYAVRPFFKAVILDDTVQPNNVINNAGTENPLLNGSAVTAPDGSILAVGFDGSNNISFYKAANLHASNGVWDTSTTLDSSGTSIRGGSAQRVIISCSDWINGSYHIDIYYFNNFGSGSNLNVIWLYSDNGGVTFSMRTIALGSGMPSSNYPGNNLSLAAFKPRLVNGVLNSGFAFIQPNGNGLASGFKCYDIIYYTYNGSFSSAIKWTAKNANSNDWTLHSLDSFYLNGVDYIVFSGFRNFIDNANVAYTIGATPQGNNSIWLTSFISKTSSTSDIISKPIQLFSAVSASAINQNNFIYPVVTVTNGTVNLLFRAITVASVSQTSQGSLGQVVTTAINYMLMNSVDGINFSYPSIVVSSTGLQLNDTNGLLSTPQNYNSYTNQGQYYYILGSGKLWEFIQNNTLADISNDIVQYSIQDSAGQPSSITLQLANQNNMWYPNGTNPGAVAIAKNKKILLQQGFYNANGVTETVPRNTYYIDDITQSTDSKSNNVTLSGRDLYKKLKTTITKYAYGWLGPYLYTDIFDGSTLNNWSQVAGVWTESSNTLVSTSTTFDSIITFNSNPTLSYGSMFEVNILRNIAGTQYIYGFFIDTNNWLRLEISSSSAWTINKCISGSVTQLDTNSYSLTSGQAYTIYVRRYDYYKFNFMIGINSNPVLGNPLAISSSVQLFANTSSPLGEFDMTANLITFASQPITFGFGTNGLIANFSFFRYSQYDNSSSVSDLIKSLGVKSKVYSYDIQNNIVDGFTIPTNYTGTFTHPNDTLVIGAGNKALNLITANQISNGEILFQAKLTPTNSANAYGFRVVFRSDNSGNEYYWHILTTKSGGYQSSRFERLYSSTTYNFPAQMSDVTTNLPATLSGNGNFDLTQIHTYKLVMVDGWLLGFIDGIMVNAYNDNNTTSPFLTTGFWGWSSDSNSTLTVYNMSSTAFWKQVRHFSLNPGDDVESAIMSLIQTIRGWIFSNLMGTLKAIFLNSTDASTYTYQNQIYAQGVDSSDKEFVSQVTVYGNNVSAIAQNTTLMAGRAVREEVIVDYSITTQQDAQTRANYELTNANQYQSQYNPKQTMNVGAELFDAVTVVDTGNNTSGVNSTTRVYAQKMTTGGSNNEYSLEIDTGSL